MSFLVEFHLPVESHRRLRGVVALLHRRAPRVPGRGVDDVDDIVLAELHPGRERRLLHELIGSAGECAGNLPELCGPVCRGCGDQWPPGQETGLLDALAMA